MPFRLFTSSHFLLISLKLQPPSAESEISQLANVSLSNCGSIAISSNSNHTLGVMESVLQQIKTAKSDELRYLSMLKICPSNYIFHSKLKPLKMMR